VIVPVFYNGFNAKRDLKLVRHRLFRGIWLLCLTLPLPQLAYADTFEVTPSLYYFQYQEFDSGHRALNEEKGLLPGLKLGFNHSVSDGIIKVQGSFFSGEVDYTGQTQSGAPHQTDTSERLIKLGLKWIPNETESIPGRLFLGFHYSDWDRDIQTRNGVLGLHEIYTWYELELGLKFESEALQHTGYWLDLSVFYVFDPNLELFLPASNVDFKLGQEHGFRLRAGKKWGNTDDLYGSVNLFAEYWEFGRSNTIFTDDFFGQSAFLVEPRSESFHTGLEFSITVKF